MIFDLFNFTILLFLLQLDVSINLAVVSKFLANGREFFTRREPSVLSAAFFIMATVAASRVLGLVRDRLLTSFFGAGSELGVFWAAAEIPDTIFYILGSAVFTTSFVPVFTRYVRGEVEGRRSPDLPAYSSLSLRAHPSESKTEALAKVEAPGGAKEEGWRMAGSVLTLAIAAFLIVAGLLFVFSYPLSRLVAPGFDSTQLALMGRLVRVMLLAQFFFVLSYFFTGVLNSFQRFLVPALAAVLYNLGVIFGVVILSPRFGIWGPVWGMVLGSLLHFLVQLPLAYSLGFSWCGLWGEFFHPGVKRVVRLMIPRVVALLGGKLSLLVQVSLASVASVVDGISNVAVLTFARHLEMLPIGLFGMSISQAAFPALALHRDSDMVGEFKKTFLSSLHQMLFLVAPAAVILLVLRIPAVRLAFGARRFTWKATILTGYVVAFFSLGVAAHAALYILNRAFYALEEARIPVQVSLVFSGLGIVLAWILVRVCGWGVWAVPLALSVAGILQAIVLLLALDRNLGRFDRVKLFGPIAKIGWSALFAGAALYVPLKLLDKLVFDTTRTLGLIVLTGIAGSFGLAVYLFFTWILGVREAKVVLRFVLSKLSHFSYRFK